MTTEIPHNELLEILHKVTYGRQDEFLDAVKAHGATPLTFERVLQHVTATVNRKYQFENGTCETNGIANIRILGDKWTSAELVGGGQRITKIYSFTGRDSFPLLEDGRYLPFAEHQTLELFVFGEAESFDIEYDIVEIPQKDMHEFVFTNLQYSGDEELTKEDSKVFLWFNHPIIQLIAKFEKPVESVELRIQEGLPYVPFRKVSDTEFVAEFGENSINFSRLHTPALLIKNLSGKNIVRCYAHSIEGIRILGGMYGMMFQK